MGERKKTHLTTGSEGWVLCERRKNYFKCGKIQTTDDPKLVTCRFCLKDLRRVERIAKTFFADRATLSVNGREIAEIPVITARVHMGAVQNPRPIPHLLVNFECSYIDPDQEKECSDDRKKFEEELEGL